MKATFKKVIREGIFAASGQYGIHQVVNLLLEGEPEKLGIPFLKNLLAYAKENTAYYQEYGGSPNSISAWPVLTKDIINSHFDDLKSRIPRKGVYENSSGGSTGNPTTVLQDLEVRIWNNATLEYYFQNFLGVSQFDVPHIILWGSDRDTMKQNNLPQKFFNWTCNEVLLNSFKISPQQWREYIKTINQVKPVYIRGYVSSLYELANQIKEHKLTVHKPKFIYSTAETLFPHIRATLEDVFQCKVYNFYGTREIGATAGECSKGNIHIFNFNNFVELEPGQYDSKIGGSVLITSLHNYTMPTIRYQIGDTAIMGKIGCSCGSRLPIIKNITGRTGAHFRKADGTMIYGDIFSHLFYGRNWIKQFQVNQHAYDSFEIKVVTNGLRPEKAELNEINKKISILMDDVCRVKWDFVENIPTTPQGKHLYTRCLIKEN